MHHLVGDEQIGQDDQQDDKDQSSVTQPLVYTLLIIAHEEGNHQLAPIRDDRRIDGSPVTEDRDQRITQHEIQNARQEDQPQQLHRVFLDKHRGAHKRIKGEHHIGEAEQTGYVARLGQTRITDQHGVDLRHPDTDQERRHQSHSLTQEIEFAVVPEVSTPEETLDLR